MMRQRPIIESLEPRILYSADLGPLAAPALLAPGAPEQRVIDDQGEFVSQTGQAVQSAPQEIVFIDARTPDSAQLVEDIAAHSGRRVDVVMLDAARDGLEQISDALAGRENVAALHIIGHGGEGVVQLGSGLVTAAALQGHAGLVESWSQALSADADILIYGCDVAASAQGRLLVDALARLTGADVSASDDPTGSAGLGGDWKLEYATGAIDVPVALSQEAQDAWSHLLADIVLVSYEPLFDNMPDNAYEVAGGGSWSQSFSYDSPLGTYTVNEIDVVLYKNPSPAGGNITVELRSALGGGGGSIIESGTVARRSLGTSEGWVAVSLSAPATGLIDGVTYFISIKGTGGGNVYVGVDNAGTYTDGTFFDTTDTAQPAKDMAFRVIASNKPVVDLNAGSVGQDVTVTFTEQTPVRVAQAGTITDPDSANLASLTVTLTARPDGDAVESLSLNAAATTAASGLTVSYTAATGVLSITGSATVVIYQAILQGIQYGNTSDAPNTTDRTVTVVADDGTTPSATRSSFVTVTAVNDAPVLTPAAPSFTGITEDDTTNTGATVATLLGASVTDVDAGALEGIAVTGLVSGNGTWQFSTDGGGSWSAVGAVAGNNALLLHDSDRLRFVPDGLNADAGSVSYRAWDRSSGTQGTKVDASTNGGSTAFSTASDTASITVTAVNDAPVNAVPAAQSTNEDTPLVFSAGNGNLISIGDIDAGASPVQVTLTATNGAITLAGTAGLTFGAGDGTADAAMTFTGTAGAINTALNGLSFAPAANFRGAASLSITTDDQGNTGAGGALSDTDAVSITVTANDAPTVTASGGTTVFIEGNNVASTPVALDSAVTVSDPDSTTLAGATVSIGAGWQAAEDVLGFTGNPATMGNIAGSYNAATGVLNLSSAGATATLAQWQASLRAVTYTNTSDTPNTAARTVSFVVNGDGGGSAASTQLVAVVAVNDAPTVTASGGTATYITAGATILVGGNVAVSDLDNATMASATVSISGGFRAAEDALGFTGNPATMGNIAGSYNAASGALSLSSAGATATLAQWQAALRSVTYINTSVEPSSATRTVSFVLSDGAALSPVVTQTLTMNVPPVVDPLPLGISLPPPVASTAPGATAVVTLPTASNPPQQTQPTPTASSPIAPAGGRLVALDAEFLTPVVDGAAVASSGSGRPQSVAATDAGVPGFRISTYGIAAPGAEVVRELFGDVIKQIEVRPLDLFQLDELQGRSAGAGGLGGDLARLQESLREQDEIQTRTVVTLTAGSLSMTLVYLIWLIRGGALAASMLSALPAWRLLDPLPILARVEDEDDQAGEEDEHSIASFSEEPGGAKRT